MNESLKELGKLTDDLIGLDEYGAIVLQSVDSKLAEATSLIKDAQMSLADAKVLEALRDAADIKRDAADVVSADKVISDGIKSDEKDVIISQLKQDLKTAVDKIAENEKQS